MRRAAPALALLALAVSSALHAADHGVATVQAPDLVTQGDWGGAGLLQTPTARMEPEGQISLSASYTQPYARYNLSMQPFPWLEGSFRYMAVQNRRYGTPGLSGDQSYKDKSIDLKLRLWPESRRLPEIALGFRDIGGTGLFSGEYLVANKRFGNVDASLGLATGYLGNRGDFANPLRLIDDRFETRPGVQGAGDFNVTSMFRGPVGIFGGVTWQTPWAPLLVKAELDGNDYENELQGLPQSDEGRARQDSPVNIGLVYRPRPGIEFTAGYERGNTALFSLAIHGNLKHARTVSSLLDRAPRPMRVGTDGDAARTHAAVAGHVVEGERSDATAAQGPWRDAAERFAAARDATRDAMAGTDWATLSRDLRREAGIAVSSISVRGDELVIAGEQKRYIHPSQGMGRAIRILDGAVRPEIAWFTFRLERTGLAIAEATVGRDAFAAYVDRSIDLPALARSVEHAPPAWQQRDLLHEMPQDRLDYGVSPGYKQVLGGPDGFILYQLSADFSAHAWLDRNTWVAGIASVDLHNNFHKFRYDAPSNLPRVRTWQREYLTTSTVTMPVLQATHTRDLGRDLYGMAYAGYLEWMYGGVGGELLYRPWGERWAVGVDVNRVRQRDFDQHFGFRDYRVTTGHVTGYVTLGDAQRVQATVSAGRYLAGDVGATFDLARRFDNGVTMGAWATKTNVSSAEFGEGSFDKGIYFSVPMDLLLPRPSRARAGFVWQPLVRDGGAKLGRRYQLYNLTGERDRDFLLDNLDRIDD